MEAIRSKVFKVCYINLADLVITIFEAPSFEDAERFALAYDGGEKEVFIKPVYKLNYTAQGREL